MSNILIIYTLLIVYVTLPSVTSKPTDDVSYIETLNIQHENGNKIAKYIKNFIVILMFNMFLQLKINGFVVISNVQRTLSAVKYA